MSKCYLLFAEGLEECEGLITLDILRRAGLETYTVSVEDAHTVVGAHGVPVTCDRTLPELLAAPIACLPVAPWLRKKLSARDEGLGAGLLRYGAPGLALLFGGLSAMKLVEAGFNPFIYFQF